LTNPINPETGEPWRIGVAHGASVSEYLAKLGASIKESADAAGVTLEFLDADYDVNTQISQIETLIANEVDIIILNPVDASAMQNPLESAAAKNIPVICVNTIVDDPSLTLAYVGSNDKEAGENIATYACEAIGGKGGVVILEGVLGMSSEVLRSEGIDNVLPNYPDVEVLARKSANWDRQEGMTTMENWAQSFGSDIKAVIAENDEMALGALQALEGAGVNDVVVVGVDGLQDAILSIADGKMACTYLQDADGQGSECIRAALIYLNGGEMQDEYNVPWQKITTDNVADYQ
ncbi:MAG: substrate-binding domain-containing protein, partial [Christensenellales bacterium]